MKKIILIIAILIVAGGGYYFIAIQNGDKDENGPKTVQVERRTIVEKALAVGTIAPVTEITVKSKVSGVVSKVFVEVGSFVKAGSPLLEVKPNPTPLELASATRDVEMKGISRATALKNKDRIKSLLDRNLISQKEYDDALGNYDETNLRLSISKEKLALIEKGKVKIANVQIESVIKAPIDGYVLERTVEIGDPIVPLTTYQAGTVLMTMADMGKLIFKGTVDEIDVGKLAEGLEAEIDIGAIPGNDAIKSKLSMISLKAKKENNTTVFPVEIELLATNGTVLRAGYSANANIIINKKVDVLSIPERVVTFRNDSAFVKLPADDGTETELYIETGLSDAIHIEILSGLKSGQDVLEKPVKEIN